MNKNTLITFLELHNNPKTRLLRKWLLEEDAFLRLSGESDISPDMLAAFFRVNGLEPTGFFVDWVEHCNEMYLRSQFLTASFSGEEKPADGASVSAIQNTKSIKTFYDRRHEAEFKAYINSQNWLAAFQLANRELLSGNQQYFDFWFYGLKNNISQ